MATKNELELNLAVAAVLAERGFLPEGTAVGDFIVICEVTGWSDEMNGMTRYANIITADNGMPSHRAEGLFEVCRRVLDQDD